jgi:UDP-GlcNAc:undecaprenyl-phosphate GlcNAc-1-phosphate transferase
MIISENLTIFIAGALTSLVFITLLHSFANNLGLIDSPCERKAHSGNIPLIGGMAVYFSFSIILIYALESSVERNLLLVASAVVVFIGVLDDKYDLTVRSRLIGQSLVSLILILGLENHFSNLGDLFSLGINIELGVFGIPFTVLAVLAVINAFNMIDGIDGLLGFVSAIFFLSLGVQAFLVENYFILTTCLVLVSCLLPFLAANLEVGLIGKKKVFMGDAGSMLMGLLIVWLTVESTQASNSQVARPVTMLFFAALPLIDMFAIIVRRLKKGKSPFAADRDHIHHIFMRGGLSPRQTLIVLTCFSFISASIGMFLEMIAAPDLIILIFFIVLCISYSFMVLHSWKFCRWLRFKIPHEKH